MEANEISRHQVLVFLYAQKAERWLSNHDFAVATGIAPRTARLHTKSLVDLGIFDQVEVFPGHRFRLAERPDTRNRAYWLRLQQAAEVFGLAE